MNALGTYSFLYIFVLVGQAIRVRKRIGKSPLTAFTQGGAVQRLGAAGGMLLPLLLLAYPMWPAWFDASGVFLFLRNLPCRLAGVALLCAGSSVAAVAFETLGDAWRLGTDSNVTRLVAEGIYARVRHPIYAGMILIWLGVFLLTADVFFLVVFLVLAAAVNGQAALEERHMERLFAEQYGAYKARTGRFFPRL